MKEKAQDKTEHCEGKNCKKEIILAVEEVNRTPRDVITVDGAVEEEHTTTNCPKICHILVPSWFLWCVPPFRLPGLPNSLLWPSSITWGLMWCSSISKPSSGPRSAPETHSVEDDEEVVLLEGRIFPSGLGEFTVRDTQLSCCPCPKGLPASLHEKLTHKIKQTTHSFQAI